MDGNKIITFEYDPEKNRRNIEKHGLSFRLARFVLADPNVVSKIDDRWDYGETRFISYGRVKGERFRLCWTWRGDNVRVISLFHVHTKEWEANYGQNR